MNMARMAMALIFAGVAVMTSDNVNADGNVAEIDGTPYTTLEDAITNASDGDTIQLTGNVTLTQTKYEITKAITINGTDSNGNTYTITGKDGNTNYAISINNIAEGKTLTLSNVKISGAINIYNSTVDLENVSVDVSGRSGIVVGDSSTVNATNVEVTGDCGAWGGFVNVDKGGVLNIDTLTGVKSIYSENSAGTAGTDTPAVQINVDDAPITITQNGGDAQGEYIGFFTSMDDAVKFYKGLTTTAADANYEIDISGDAELNGDLTLTAKTAMNIGGEGSLTVAKNSPLTNNGTITNTGVIRNSGTIEGTGNLNNNGQIYNVDNAVISCSVTGNQPLNGLGLSTNMDAIESDLPLTGYAFLTGNLTIPEGKSITVRSNGVLDLQGNTLNVKGELIVETGGTIIGSGANNIIQLDGGKISNTGIIGSGSVPVTVQVSNTSKVTMLNVEGVSFGTAKVSGTNYLTVTGDVITAIGTYTDYQFNIDGAYITGTLSIDTEIETQVGANGVTVMKGATFEIDGTVTGEAIKMENGSTVVVNGTCGADIKASTGTKKTTGSEALGTTTVTLNDVTGVTVTVSSNAYVKVDDNGKSASYTDYILYIQGAVDYVEGNTAETGSIEIVNTTGAISKVAAETELVLPDGVTMNAGGTVVLGTIEFVESETAVKDFDGTRYTIKDGTKSTYFIKEFTAALGQIANADRNTVTVFGDVEVTQGFELTDKQTVVIDSTATFEVAEDAKVILQSGARINGTVSEVTGILNIQRGGNVQNVAKYAVYTEGTDGSKTYAGFVAAIENSAAGDRITVSGVGYGDDKATGLVVEETVSIPADRTVIITKNIFFEGNLTIDEGATVNNQSTITMLDEAATITVNGVLDSTAANASIVFDDSTGEATDRNVYANGEYKVAAGKLSIANATVNGAYYVSDDAIVVTTFSKAVAAAAASDEIADVVTVIGTVSESGEVAVTGTTAAPFQINIGDSDNRIRGYATLGTVTISCASVSVTANSELTAEIVGSFGTDGSAAESVITLGAAKGFAVTSNYAPDDMAQNVWYTAIGYSGTVTAFTGSVEITSGEVELSDANTSYQAGSSEGDAFVVGADGTLVVPANVEMKVTGKASVAGTVSVEENGSVSIYNTTVSGTVEVASKGTVKVNNVTLTGTLTIAEGSVAEATGELRVGETPKLLGSSVSATGTVEGTLKVLPGTNNVNKVIVYNGASVDGMKLVENDGTTAAKHTAYVINGIPYATVYGYGKIVDINDDVKQMKDLDIDDTKENKNLVWYSGETEVKKQNVGAFETVTTTVDYAGVNVIFSVGQGITLSVDNIIWNGGEGKNLTIGVHKVSAVVSPGYEGTITLTFNGQAVTNGEIEITSDMLGTTPVLSATGDITTSGSGTIVVDSGSDDMSLTDILLIVLVVLIVIMAVIVALRLMRS